MGSASAANQACVMLMMRRRYWSSFFFSFLLFFPIHIVPGSGSEVCAVSPPSRQPSWWNGHLQPARSDYSSCFIPAVTHSLLGPPTSLFDVVSRAFPLCGGAASTNAREPFRLRSINCLTPPKAFFPTKGPRKSSPKCPLSLLECRSLLASGQFFVFFAP